MMLYNIIQYNTHILIHIHLQTHTHIYNIYSIYIYYIRIRDKPMALQTYYSYYGCCSVASTAVQQLQSLISTCICLAPANGKKKFLTKGNCMSHSFLWSHRSITHPPIGSTGPVHAMGITGACRRFQHCPGQYFVGKNESSYVVPLSKPETQETKCGDSGHSAPIFSDRNFAPWAYHFDQTKT